MTSHGLILRENVFVIITVKSYFRVEYICTSGSSFMAWRYTLKSLVLEAGIGDVN
jgi:hypothetical protein